MKRLLYILFVCATLALGCASGKAQRSDYQSQVERAFQKAEYAMERGDYVDATARYQAIRSQYQYSKYATPTSKRRSGRPRSRSTAASSSCTRTTRR